MKLGCSAAFVTLGLGLLAAPYPAAQQTGSAAPGVVLRPTDHPPVPAEPSELWMVPTKAHSTRTAPLNAFLNAVKLEDGGSSATALPILSQPLLHDHPLRDYVAYYKGLSELSLGRTADARRTFRTLSGDDPDGFLDEAAALREAEASEGLGDYSAALAIYERLSGTRTTSPDDVLMRVGRTAEATGNLEKALRAYSLAYYEFPFSDLAPAAGQALARLPGRPPLEPGTNRFKLDLGRAERLFAARRYPEARAAFAALKAAARDDDLELVNLRIAETDFFGKRLRAARDGVKPYTEKAARQGEALFFYAVSLHGLGERDEYFRVVRRIADGFPTQTWAEEALNNLATHYILEDEDDKADQTFREMFAKSPSGRYAERAAWKIGWRAYRNRDYAETIRVFERGAANFPRSDYRPAWLYWSARAYEALNLTAQAQDRHALSATDYYNSYYGRLSRARLAAPLSQITDSGNDEDATGEAVPPNAETVRALLGLGLYDHAIAELRYAQKVWGDSAAIQATLAWTYQKQGQAEKGGWPQFTHYRNSINTMKRAYPQYLAVEGERLSHDILRIIFPLSYWDLIRKYAAANKLDPFLVAALMAQESTFVRDIRSPAKAVGLMQLMPATARQVARRLKLRYSASLLTNPEASIRLGTSHLADNLKEFGAMHLVLASYNAGETPVRRWLAERPGVPRDEFIDDIPYPETQNYVKRILGTAEDYRRLYSE